MNAPAPGTVAMHELAQTRGIRVMEDVWDSHVVYKVQRRWAWIWWTQSSHDDHREAIAAAEKLVTGMAESFRQVWP